MHSLYSLCRLAVPSMARKGDQIVAINPMVSVTYSDFIDRVNDWQSYFHGLPGETFALFLDDSAELAAALLGAWHAKKIIALPGDILPSTLNQLSEIVDANIGEFPSAISIPAKGFANSSLLRLELNPNAQALVIFTSGSTGAPCAIEKRIGQLDAELEALESCFKDVVGNAVIYGTVSHQHIYGLLFRVLWPLAIGRVFYSQRLEYPEQIAKFLAGQSSVLISSPAQLKRLPDHIDWKQMNVGLKAVFSSGGPLSADSADKVTQLWHRRPIEVFGSSETGGIAWRQSENGFSSWQALPGVECQISGGHLQVRSSHLPNNDWFTTQDKAVLRDGNQFELLGRSDRIIKLEERRISLSLIENHLSRQDWVRECRLLVLPGRRERLGSVVVLNAEGRQFLQDCGKLAVVNRLKNALEKTVDPIAIPRYWRFLDMVPVDSQGKTSQRMLIELFRMSLPECRILQRSDILAKLELNVSKDLIVFDGHFSHDIAVVPGVMLIDWAIKNGRALFSMHPHFIRIEALKFQQVIRPDTTVHLDIEWNEIIGVLKFRYESVHGLHASGRILFTRVRDGSAASQ